MEPHTRAFATGLIVLALLATLFGCSTNPLAPLLTADNPTYTYTTDTGQTIECWHIGTNLKPYSPPHPYFIELHREPARGSEPAFTEWYACK